jgi:two-component system, NarL family, nitrate/nitrite response regulator NarL
LLRDGLEARLAAHPAINFLGCYCVAEMRAFVEASRPDVVLLDLSSRQCLAIPPEIRAVLPRVQFVAFAVADGETDALACAEAGVCGFVAQEGSVEDLIAAVGRAMEGEVVCSPRLAALLIQRVADLSAHRLPQVEPLTPREQEIAAYVARGLPNKDIARRLGLAPATVKNHVHNILQKLSLARRSELAARSFVSAPPNQPALIRRG